MRDVLLFVGGIVAGYLYFRHKATNDLDFLGGLAESFRQKSGGATQQAPGDQQMEVTQPIEGQTQFTPTEQAVGRDLPSNLENVDPGQMQMALQQLGV